MRMTKKERVLSVLNGKKPDRIPAGFWHHFPEEQAHGEANVEAHLQYFKETGIDFIKIMSDGLSYPLNITINQASDWKKLKPLDKSHPFFVESVARCKAINKALNGEAVTFFNLFSPFNTVRERDVFTQEALQGRSWDATLMANLREDEEAVRYAMHIIGEDVAYLAKAIIVEGGCLGVYQSVQGAEKGRFTAEEYARIVTPTEVPILEAANSVSKYNILHLCSWAGNPNHLSYWKDYPALVKNWGTGVEEMNMTQARAFFPEGTVLLGGLDNRRGHALVSGTEQEIRAAVDDVLQQMEGVPFILGADCTVPGDIDLNHIRFVMDELEKKA